MEKIFSPGCTGYLPVLGIFVIMPGRLFFMLTLLGIFFFPGRMQGQNDQARDSVYYKIEKFSGKRKFSKMLYRFLFRDVPDSVVVPENKDRNKAANQGKFIRNIYIESFDPLGFSMDKGEKEKRWYEEFGNRLHIKSRGFAIRGYLLFKKGEEYDPQKLYESERMLRNTGFVNRVSIMAADSTLTSDSIDIAVRVMDSWSLKPSLSFSGKKLGLGASEENFFGLGHQIAVKYRTDFETKQNYLFGSYSANNIYGTYIDATIAGENDFDHNENVYIRASRAFFSPLTRWAGGISLDYFRRHLEIPLSVPDRLFPQASIKVYHQDFWSGYQFRLGENSAGDVTENIGISARFENYIYQEAPDENVDPYHFFDSYNVALMSVGYSQRKFSVERNVFQHNLPEDIPYGKLFSVTGGFTRRDGISYPYAGASAAYGFFSALGYLNMKAQFGSFYKEAKNYRSTFRFDATYFTHLTDWKFAKARHFFAPTLVLGNDRSPSYADRINLSGNDEFPPYDQNYLGTDKLVLRYQLQLFVNKSWKNFYYDPFFITSLGWLSNDTKSIFRSDIHCKFGVGLMIYNPYLAFNRFQISFVYYPGVPFDSRSVFDFNSYKNYNIPVSTFSPEEPSIVNYGAPVYQY